MSFIRFCNTTDPINLLVKILEDIYHKGKRAVVKSKSHDEMTEIDNMLWIRSDFLPHAKNDVNRPIDHPIMVTDDDNIENGAEIVIFMPEARPHAVKKQKHWVIIMQNINSEMENLWLEFVKQGKKVRYWSS